MTDVWLRADGSLRMISSLLTPGHQFNVPIETKIFEIGGGLNIVRDSMYYYWGGAGSPAIHAYLVADADIDVWGRLDEGAFGASSGDSLGSRDLRFARLGNGNILATRPEFNATTESSYPSLTFQEFSLRPPASLNAARPAR